MKDFGKVGYLFFCGLFFLLGCQKEEIIREGDDSLPEQLADMVMKVVTHDGSYDDVVDGGNCFSIDIPYAIWLNDDRHTVKGVEDYLGIRESDKISVEFPIMVTTHDHKKKIIANAEELAALVATCNVVDDDIECVDFVYPFIFQTFDELTNRIETIKVLHDKQIFEFMEGLSPSTKVSIKYPIDLVLYDGQNAVAGHNEALMETILGVVNACDEGDN